MDNLSALITEEDLHPDAPPPKDLGTLVARMAAYGLALADIASILGLTPMQVHSRYADYLQAGQAVALASIGRKAYQLALEGNPDMVKFFLKARGRGQWSEKVHIEVEHKGDPAAAQLSAKQKLAVALGHELTADGHALPQPDENFGDALKTSENLRH
jgi:hypothetical protein